VTVLYSERRLRTEVKNEGGCVCAVLRLWLWLWLWLWRDQDDTLAAASLVLACL